MRIVIAALGLATAVALVACPPAVTTTTFRATLSGANEVPPVSGNGAGTVTATLTGSTLTLTGTYTGLTGAPTLQHIHGPAAAGNSAPPICNLYTVDGTPAVGSGSISGAGAASNACSSRTLSAQEIADLNNGLWYVNLHTTANSNGEVRGQLIKQ